jgi:hypothetical protein
MLLAGIHACKTLTYANYSMDSILRYINNTSTYHFSGQNSYQKRTGMTYAGMTKQ